MPRWAFSRWGQAAGIKSWGFLTLSLGVLVTNHHVARVRTVSSACPDILGHLVIAVLPEPRLDLAHIIGSINVRWMRD